MYFSRNKKIFFTNITLYLYTDGIIRLWNHQISQMNLSQQTGCDTMIEFGFNHKCLGQRRCSDIIY